MDSLTHAPLQNVSISIKTGSRSTQTDRGTLTDRGTQTDADGKFRIRVDRTIKKLQFTSTGYRPISLSITDYMDHPGQSDHSDSTGHPERPITVLLAKAYTTLKGVVIKGKRGKYRNKNNPAVELIRKVIANKPYNGPGSPPYTSYEQYEKIRMLLDKPPRLIVDNKLLKQYHFLFENKDSVLVPGKSLTPVYIEEIAAEKYYRKHPESDKKIILGRKSVDFGEYVDMKGVSTALNRLYEDINIYDNAITAFTMQFISPIADLAPTFYMYFIRDTIEENGEKLVQLYFTPRNPEDLLFRGTLYVTLDGNYAVRRIELGVSQHINLNFVRDFKVDQEFEKGPGRPDSAGHPGDPNTGNSGRYHLATSHVIARFSPFPKSPGLFGERTVVVSHFSNDTLADVVFKGPSVDSLPQASHQADSFWNGGRPSPLTASEKQTYINTDRLLKMRSYRRLMDYTTAFTAGYKSAGKVDIGPIGTFYTFNPIEGSRLRFGARTNTKLSTRYYGESYVAYGFKDERWKYFGSVSYALNNKSIYTFPLHYVQVSYMHDTRNLGQENVFAQGGNFFSSFNRGNNSKWLYNDLLKLSYIQEFGNHLSYTLGVKYWQQRPTGSLIYRYEPFPDQFDTVRRITTSELSVTLRWAPHEQFFQNKAGRSDITNKYPIMTFLYAKGIHGLAGGEYNYDAFHLNIYKRLYLAPFGFSDITADAGLLAGNLPFPLLVIHPANQSYFYTQNSYNLMNIGEFVSDHYAALNIDHFFNGFFFNKIPGLKRLRLREVIAAKVLYGGLRDENNPAINAAQMRFPLTKGLTSTYALGSKPYVETSVGIYNIFSIIRLDLVKRWTYLQNPNISDIGLRVSTNFNF